MPTVSMVNIMPRPIRTAEAPAMVKSFESERDDLEVVI